MKKAAKANLRHWVAEQTDEAIAIAQCREALRCTIEARSAAVRRAEGLQTEIDAAAAAEAAMGDMFGDAEGMVLGEDTYTKVRRAQH